MKVNCKKVIKKRINIKMYNYSKLSATITNEYLSFILNKNVFFLLRLY